MKTKKLFIIIGLLAAIHSKAVFAQEPLVYCDPCTPCCEGKMKDSYPYLSIGIGPLPILLPNFNIGWRHQCEHFGVDVGINAATALVATQLKGYANWLYYFNPSLCSQTYCGLGASVGGWLIQGEHNVVITQPNFILGKSFMSHTGDRTFLQAEVSWPTVLFNKTTHHLRHKHTDANVREYFRKTYRHSKLQWKLPMVTVSYGWGF